MAAPVHESATSNAREEDDTPLVVKPSGTVEGDLVIAYAAAGADGLSAISGWTNMSGSPDNYDSGDHYSVCCWKIAGASEPSGWDFTGGTGEADHIVGASRISGVDTGDPIDVSGNNSGDSSNPVAPSITTTVSDTLLVAAAMVGDNVSPIGQPSGYTEEIDINLNASDDSTLDVAWAEFAGPGSTGTKSFSTGPGDPWSTYHIAVAPPAAVGGAAPFPPWPRPPNTLLRM